jgi:hypothetical protein
MLHVSARQIFERVPRAIRITALIVILFGPIGFLVLPPVLRHAIATQVAKHLRRPATVEQVRMNSFSLSVSVGGLKVNESGS